MVSIKKKVRGKKEYYYLEQSIRDGRRIIKKEVYLGTEIPYDIDSIKAKFEKELKLPLYEKLDKIKKNFQAEWKKLPKSARERELDEIAIAFTYNTNALEGSTITLEETREILQDKIAPNKPLRDIKETEAHAKIFLEMLQKKENISNELILEWHKKIFGQTKQDIAGKYREYLVHVGSYYPPDWQDIEKMMGELIVFINKNKKMNSVELSARAHYKFEKTHPFGDGNGRIGRLLMNYILWYDNYPMLIIEYKKRRSYYKALQKDEEGFVSYFIRRYLAVHKSKID
ncbi:MAG: Fic family protein [Nanoarchaeota archaeon]|nr:Fic family protein [Nanoarchaeota archaeon]